MKKQQRASKAAFDRWFIDTYGKPLSESQFDKLYRARARAEAALEIARARVDAALENTLAYEDCYAAWLAAQEANNE